MWGGRAQESLVGQGQLRSQGPGTVQGAKEPALRRLGSLQIPSNPSLEAHEEVKKVKKVEKVKEVKKRRPTQPRTTSGESRPVGFLKYATNVDLSLAP